MSLTKLQTVEQPAGATLGWNVIFLIAKAKHSVLSKEPLKEEDAVKRELQSDEEVVGGGGGEAAYTKGEFFWKVKPLDVAPELWVPLAEAVIDEVFESNSTSWEATKTTLTVSQRQLWPQQPTCTIPAPSNNHIFQCYLDSAPQRESNKQRANLKRHAENLG